MGIHRVPFWTSCYFLKYVNKINTLRSKIHITMYANDTSMLTSNECD